MFRDDDNLLAVPPPEPRYLKKLEIAATILIR
jgi:hypothetical protein